MTGGITSVPLPAYWSSKDPEQWRRHPLKSLAWRNPRCAANNAIYAAISSESPAKQSRRPYNTYSKSRSVSATSVPSTPVEQGRNSKSEYVNRCNDCNAPLVHLARPVSSSTTFTPPTPLQVRAVVTGSYVARVNRSHGIPYCVQSQVREPPPYFHKRSTTKKNSCAPPPSECDDFSSEDSVPCFRNVRHSDDVGGEASGKDLASKRPSSYDEGSARVTAADIETSTSSLTTHSESNSYEAETMLSRFTRISENEITTNVQGPGSENENPYSQENSNQPSPLKASGDGSESSVSPALSEKGLSLISNLQPVCDRNRISSFYNALYTPDAYIYEREEADLDVRRIGGELDLKLKLAVEIAVLSAFVTMLIFACFPSFLSGVRYYVFGCCSCTCQTAARIVDRTQSGQFKWFERWVYRGAHNMLSCRSPRQAVGSTVLS